MINMTKLRDFLSFKRMLTSSLIQVIFWLGLVILILAAVFGSHSITKALVVLIVGPLLLRIFCEWAIVLFRILDVLTEINQKLSIKINENPNSTVEQI
jgi:hypothetical protein